MRRLAYWTVVVPTRVVKYHGSHRDLRVKLVKSRNIETWGNFNMSETLRACFSFSSVSQKIWHFAIADPVSLDIGQRRVAALPRTYPPSPRSTSQLNLKESHFGQRVSWKLPLNIFQFLVLVTEDHYFLHWPRTVQQTATCCKASSPPVLIQNYFFKMHVEEIILLYVIC